MTSSDQTGRRAAAHTLLIVLVSAAIGLTFSPATAGAADPILSVTHEVTAGHRASLKATFATPPRSCELRATSGHHSILLDVRTLDASRIEWSWAVPTRARSATWQLKLACGPLKVNALMRVRGRARIRSSVLRLSAGSVRVRQLRSEIQTEEGSSEVEAPAASTSPALPDGSSLFSLAGGECTDWGYFKRPDIYNNRSAQDPNPGNWVAWTWAEHARLEGLRVDATPEVGAIAVWPATSENQTGHVSYVETITGSGASETVAFSEMNNLSATPQTITVEGVAYTYETETDGLASLTALGVVFIHQR